MLKVSQRENSKNRYREATLPYLLMLHLGTYEHVAKKELGNDSVRCKLPSLTIP